MYKNIGRKIKILAQFICWMGIILSVVVGIAIIISVMLSYKEGLTFAIIGGVLIMIIGGIFSWLQTFVLYGFGQLVENSDILVTDKNNSELLLKQEEII